MNEATFTFFLMYIADLHNLKIESTLRVMARPKVRGAEKANPERLKALSDVKVRTFEERIRRHPLKESFSISILRLENDTPSLLKIHPDHLRTTIKKVVIISFKVLLVTWETPGYISQPLASLMKEKPKSVVSHSDAAAVNPVPTSSTVKLFYQTPASKDDFICVICHKSYKSLGTMSNHLRTKHGQTLVIKCDLCHTVFEDARALNRHAKAKSVCTKL